MSLLSITIKITQLSHIKNELWQYKQEQVTQYNKVNNQMSGPFRPSKQQILLKHKRTFREFSEVSPTLNKTRFKAL